MSSSSIGQSTRDANAAADPISQQARLNAATSTATRGRRRKRSSGKLVFTSVSIVVAVVMSIFVWSMVLKKTSEYRPGAGMVEPQPALQTPTMNTDLSSPRIVSRTTP